MFSIRGDYLNAAYQGDEEKRRTLEAISSKEDSIELALKGPQRPLLIASQVNLAREFDLEPVTAHAAQNLDDLHETDGMWNLVTNIRHMNIDYDGEPDYSQEGSQTEWRPKKASFHPSRIDRTEAFDEHIKNSVYNLSAAGLMLDENYRTRPLIENVNSRYDPSFSLESVEDAERWEEIAEKHLPDHAREHVAYVFDSGHAEHPLDMIDALSRNIEEAHLHNRVETDSDDYEPTSSGRRCDTHRPPYDGEIEMQEVLAKLDDLDGEVDVVWEIKSEHLSPETVERTYDHYGQF